MNVYDEMKRIFEVQEEEQKNIRDVGEYLDENVLEIIREQSLGYDGWTTSTYTLVTGTGGPHVEFDTQYYIRASWGGEKFESCTYDEDVRAIIDEIEQWLDELY